MEEDIVVGFESLKLLGVGAHFRPFRRVSVLGFRV